MRVTPSIRSQRGLQKKTRFRLMLRKNFFCVCLGWIWTKNPMTADHWLLDVKLRVTGRGRVGADGMVRE